MAVERSEGAASYKHPARRYYVDLDGALTGQEGSKTVSSDSYRELATKETNAIPYHLPQFIFRPQAEVVDMLKIQMMDNDKLGLTKGALDFLQKEAKDDSAEIIIISRNRREYAEAIILASGGSKELLSSIKIFDVQNLAGKNKEGVVQTYEKEHGSADVTVIADDALKDCDAMRKGLIASGSQTKLATLNYEAGVFPWNMISRGNYQLQVITPDEKTLTQVLKQGTPTTFKEKPGQYLVFNDENSFNDALTKLKDDETLASSFRKSRNPLTIEIMDRIKLEKGSIVIEGPPKKLSR